MRQFLRRRASALQRFVLASEISVLSPGYLVSAQVLSYKNPEAVRAASGRRNPFSAVGAGRCSTKILWPMAGGL